MTSNESSPYSLNRTSFPYYYSFSRRRINKTRLTYVGRACVETVLNQLFHGRLQIDDNLPGAAVASRWVATVSMVYLKLLSMLQSVFNVLELKLRGREGRMLAKRRVVVC